MKRSTELSERPKLRRSPTVAILATAALTLLVGCSETSTISPTAAPSVAPTSSLEEDREQEQLDSLWALVVSLHPDAVRPTVDRVRFIQPAEWPQTQADCTREEGFDVIISLDGGLSSPQGLPDAQREAYRIARYVCNAKYPIDPKYSEPLTPEQIAAVYDYYLQDLIPCLEGEGYPVPSPPSRSLFLETFLSSKQWIPYSEVFWDADVPEAEFMRVSEKCPQWPSGLYG